MADIKVIKLPSGREHKIGYEFFYEDEDGYLQDADIHEPILTECDSKILAKHNIELAEKLGCHKVASLLRSQTYD